MVFHRYKKDAQGNVSIMFALCLLAVLAGSGAALDYLRMSKTNVQLQSLTDSIALAAAIGIRNEEHNLSNLDEFASTYLAQTEFPDARPVWEISDTGLELTLQVDETMTFMSLFGDSKKPVSTIARVPVQERKDVSVALVLDATLSMQGSKIRSLKSAANELIDILTEDDTNETFISVVPFTSFVKIPVAYGNEVWFDKPADKDIIRNVINEDLSENCRTERIGEYRQRVCDVTVQTQVPDTISWNGCTISRDFGFHNVPEFNTQRLQGVTRQDYCSDDRNTMAPMTSNVTDIKDTVRSMIPHGTTYIPTGLIWGWRTLQEAEPLTEIRDASDGSQKIMVLMTDGANEVSLGKSVPWSNGIFHDGDDIDAADALTAELCEGVKSEDIIIFTIALEVDDADTISLMRNCATSQGHFYDLSDASALSNAFKNIGFEVDDIRLSY